jgi:NADPH:quinone reductase-like Zn-dependent oxidoreductase
VVEVGDGVIDWNIGDRVLSTFFPDWRDGEPTMANTRRLAGESTDGCAAEFSLCLPESLTTIPRQYSYLEAATLPCAGLTAWRAMLEIGRIKAGDSVLVQGSGGASIFALQFARAMGAKVFATSSSAEKGHRLRELGADEVVNYQNDTNWGKTICALAGEGVDHVVDIWGRLNSDELDRRCPRGGQRSTHRHAGGH